MAQPIEYDLDANNKPFILIAEDDQDDSRHESS